MNTDELTRAHVLSAIEEYDDLGDVVFHRRYGFTHDRDGLLWHSGRSYEVRALIGVAQKFATGKAARPEDVTLDREQTEALVSGLDFEVVRIGDEPTVAPADGEETATWREAADLGNEEARQQWSAAARTLLIETAGHYHAVASYQELATLVQTRTGIRSRQQVHHWVGDVLTRVSLDCAERGEPLLSSLCVTTGGTVGSAYGPTVTKLRGEQVEDADDHAAVERLACYRHFGATLPDDGGEPALTPEVINARERKRSAKPVERVDKICPTCFMALLPTGVCDNCD